MSPESGSTAVSVPIAVPTVAVSATLELLSEMEVGARLDDETVIAMICWKVLPVESVVCTRTEYELFVLALSVIAVRSWLPTMVKDALSVAPLPDTKL